MAHIKPKSSITFFLARILLPPLLILLSVLLLWIYFESQRNIRKQQDLSFEFNNRNTVRELDYAQQHYTGLLEDAVFSLSKASGKDGVLSSREIQIVLTYRNVYEFDLLRFVPVNSEHDVVENDSHFFDFNTSRDVCGYGPDFFHDTWRLIDAGLHEKPVWIMVYGKRVIQESTGQVLGMLVGGVVLNNNQELVRTIQLRSVKVMFAALEVKGEVLAFNKPLPQALQNMLKEISAPVTRSVLSGSGITSPVILTRFSYPFSGSSDLNVILVYRDSLQSELRLTLLRSGGIALFFTILVFVVFTRFARNKTEDALVNLLRYTETAAVQPREAEYIPGPLLEFNRIGDSVEKMIGLLNDTTEELQESKELLELTIEGASLGTWDWDIATGEVSYNERWATMLGYERDEVVGNNISNWRNLLHPDEKDVILEKLIEHLDGNTPVYQSEHRLKNKSGDWMWVLDAGRVYKRDKDGTPERAVGIHLDITRIKVAEQALKKERSLLLSIINAIPDLIFYKNDKGAYLGCNKAFEKLAGRTVEEIVNKTDQDIFSADVAKLFREQDRVMLALGKSYRNDDWVTYPDGSRVLLDTIKIPFAGSGKETLGIIGVSRDVTHKKKMEDELLKIEKLESVAVLAGGIAHDFNNILTAVLGNIELANYRFRDKDEMAAGLLDEAGKATRRAVKLTRQLLTFAKGGELIRESTDLSLLIKETAGFVLHGSAIVCKYNFPENLWLADADSGQISQVIQNIVINAKQAMKEGGIIRIRCENVENLDDTLQGSSHCGGFVKIVISDTGSGISKENMDKIFDPYFTTKHKGSGLGLAVSHSIVLKHQGVMTVQSQIDIGTIFTIFLPAMEDGEGDDVTGKGTELLPGKKGKILLMDDEKVVLDVVGIQLKTIGHEVDFAIDGNEAVEKYREALSEGNAFDMVIVDLTIPAGMGGEEAAGHILEMDKEAKIVVVSGYATAQIMENFEDYGFKATLTKPFGLVELSRILKKVLG